MKKISTLSLLLFFCFKITAQSTSPGFDSLFASQLQQKLNSLGTSGNFKGLSAAAIIPGQGIWVGTWGQAAPGQPLTPDMRLGVASNSKAFTAALLLKLQEEGLLDLDDPLFLYLPPHPYIDGNITVRQLLTHTSGLFDFINSWSGQTAAAYNSNPDSVWTPNDLFATIGPPALLPGRRFSYSNTNYLLAGMVAAEVADTSVGFLLHQKIFEPLGLSSMAFPPYDDVFAAPFSNLWNGNNTILTPGGDASFLTFPSTAGGIWSTAYDMVRWYDALFGKNWLTPPSQAELRQNDGHSAYALGIRLKNDFGRSFYYHAGAWGFRSHLLHEPESGISVCILSNLYGKSVSTQTEALFQEILNKKPKKHYDLAVSGIEHPGGTVCPGSFSPVLVTVENKGLIPLDSLWVQYGEDGDWLDSFLYILPFGLEPGASVTLGFEVSVSPVSLQKRRFQIHVAPVQADGYQQDNFAFSDYRFMEGDGLPLPYFEGFETATPIPPDWVSLRPENLLDWRRTDFTALEGRSSLARNNYDDGNPGDSYAIELPALKITGSNAVLNFSFAHAFYPGYPSDKFSGFVSTDCGETFEPLFELSGSNFETAPNTSDLFLPLAVQWQTRSYPLDEFAGQHVLIRFVSESGFSNMLYLDNVSVTQAVPVREEIARPAVKVSPNPANKQVEISIQGLAENQQSDIRLVNTLGRGVFRGRMTGNGVLQIQRRGLPAGVYFLTIENGQGVLHSERVVFLGN